MQIITLLTALIFVMILNAIMSIGLSSLGISNNIIFLLCFINGFFLPIKITMWVYRQ